jgi:hypothetical protein
MAVPWRYDSFRSSYTMILLPILLLVVPCVASPVIMVNSGKAKCFSIEAVMDTIVRVTYEAPGKSTFCVASRNLKRSFFTFLADILLNMLVRT